MIHQKSEKTSNEEVSNIPNGGIKSRMLIMTVSTSLGLILGGGGATWHTLSSAKDSNENMPKVLEKTFSQNDDLTTFIGRSKKLKISQENIIEIDIKSVLLRPIQKSQYPNATFSVDTSPTEEEPDKALSMTPETPMALPTPKQKTENTPTTTTKTPPSKRIVKNKSIVFDGSAESKEQLITLLKEFSQSTGGKKK